MYHIKIEKMTPLTKEEEEKRDARNTINRGYDRGLDRGSNVTQFDTFRVIDVVLDETQFKAMQKSIIETMK